MKNIDMRVICTRCNKQWDVEVSDEDDMTVMDYCETATCPFCLSPCHTMPTKDSLKSILHNAIEVVEQELLKDGQWMGVRVAWANIKGMMEHEPILPCQDCGRGVRYHTLKGQQFNGRPSYRCRSCFAKALEALLKRTDR